MQLCLLHQEWQVEPVHTAAPSAENAAESKGKLSSPFPGTVLKVLHLEGEAVRSCGVAMSDAAGKAVVTIEGLDSKGNHPVQVAWRNLGVPQCGYCQTGQIMQAAALLVKTPAPTDAQIDSAMSGNLCRCGCYQRIHAAVRAASKGA